MMMRAKKIAAKLDMLRQPALASVSGMEQQKFGRRRHLAFEETPLEWVQGHGSIGARDQHHAVRLSEAETRPSAIGLIALIEHHIMFGFEPVEPLGRFVAGGAVEHRSLGAHLHQY